METIPLITMATVIPICYLLAFHLHNLIGKVGIHPLFWTAFITECLLTSLVFIKFVNIVSWFTLAIVMTVLAACRLFAIIVYWQTAFPSTFPKFLWAKCNNYFIWYLEMQLALAFINLIGLAFYD